MTKIRYFSYTKILEELKQDEQKLKVILEKIQLEKDETRFDSILQELDDESDEEG